MRRGIHAINLQKNINSGFVNARENQSGYRRRAPLPLDTLQVGETDTGLFRRLFQSQASIFPRFDSRPYSLFGLLHRLSGVLSVL